MPTETIKRIIANGGLGRFEEFEAAEAITPGQLLEITSGGKVQKASSAGAISEIIFAKENDLAGGAIGDDYSSGDRVQCYFPLPGDEIYGWLSAAVAATSSVTANTSALESAGDGGFIATTAETEPALAFAKETLDKSSTGDTDTRLKIRII